MTIRQRIQARLARRPNTDPYTMTRKQLIDRVLDLESRLHGLRGRLSHMSEMEAKNRDLTARLKVWRSLK